MKSQQAFLTAYQVLASTLVSRSAETSGLVSDTFICFVTFSGLIQKRSSEGARSSMAAHHVHHRFSVLF